MTHHTRKAADSLQVRHKTLSAYYTRIYRLKDCFTSATTSTADSTEYTDFVATTLCAIKQDTGAIPLADDSRVWRSLPSSQRRTQQEWVDSTIGDLAKRGAPDILLRRERIDGQSYAPGVNGRTAPSSTLCGPAWRALRDRVGDASLRHLILHTSIFIPVGNNCFVQMSGSPILDLHNRAGAASPSKKRKRSLDERPPRRVRRRKSVDAAELKNGIITRSGDRSPADTYIARQRMFYGQPARTREGSIAAGLHPQHGLNKIARDAALTPEEKYEKLLCLIFGYSTPPKRPSAAQVQRRAQLLHTMETLMERHGKIAYGRMLQTVVERSHDPTRDELQPISHSQVCRYVASVLRELLPMAVIGSAHNLQVIKRHAKCLVTAKQFEQMNLHVLMSDLRVDEIAWTSIVTGRPTAAEYKKRRSLAEKFVFWLFNDYLVSLLRNSFYVTESSATRYQTVYYAHDAWAKATKPYFAKLQKDHLEPLTVNDKASVLSGMLSVSAVRLIPKPNGFRPIVNLGRRAGAGSVASTAKSTKKSSAANDALRGVHQVLTYEKEHKREHLGSSLFGTNEIFAPLHNLQSELLNLHGQMPRLYFVKMDIKAAFDTIKQDNVLRVVRRLLDANYDYVLMMFGMMLPPASKASQGSARRMFKTRAVIDDDFASTFGELAKDVAGPLRNAVLVDLMRKTRLSRDDCMKILTQHITRNIWQIGNKFFRQREGIPQGSKISSMLCSIFYAALEKQYLAFLSKPGSRLLRYIDDFLYITDDFASAKRFIEIMSRGFPEYGAYVSTGKTLTSFEHARGNMIAPVCAHKPDGGSYFPFCGFLIDTKSLEMSPDVPRMVDGDMAQSFALRFIRRRGKAFVGWLSRQLENRNHIAYLDTTHNSLDTVHLNVFLNFATTGMKIPHYFDASQPVSPHLAKIIFDSICSSVEYTYVAGRARVRHANRRESDQAIHYTVRKVDFEFLAKSALVYVLRSKASRFKDVLLLLEENLKRKEYRNLSQRHDETIRKGWDEVKTARY